MFLHVLLQWLETEKLRLGHLRDRASEKGRKKEYPTLEYTMLSSASFAWQPRYL